MLGHEALKCPGGRAPDVCTLGVPPGSQGGGNGSRPREGILSMRFRMGSVNHPELFKIVHQEKVWVFIRISKGPRTQKSRVNIC